MGEVIANSPTPGVAAQLTTLGALIASAGTTSITASAAVTGNLLNGNFRIVIGDGVQNSGAYETLLVTAGQSTTTWTVTRGVEGSTAATWNNSTPIWHVWTAAGVTAASAATLGWLPRAALAQNMPRDYPFLSATNIAITGGVHYLMLIWLTAGVTYSSMTMASGSSAFSTNSRFAILYDDDLGSTSGTGYGKLAASNSDTGNWATNTSRTISYASAYTPTRTGWFYAGFLVTATSGNFRGMSQGDTGTFAYAPKPMSSGGTGASTPADPAPAQAVSAGVPYCYLS